MKACVSPVLDINDPDQRRLIPNSLTVMNVTKREAKQGRPTPMNTVAFLKACSKNLGIGPHAALQTAERLYLAGYLSYPRTESSAYPKSFDIRYHLEQQANHGALETAEVHALMRYLCELIASWQAPVDDAEMRRWVASVEASLAGTADQPLADFIGVHMVTFVREAIGRVRRVYERLVALAATAEPANGNAAAAEANADRNAAAADAA